MIAVLNRLMSLALEASSSAVVWVAYFIGSCLFLINASLRASLAFTTIAADIVHLHATHGIFVIGVDGFNIFVDHLIKRTCFLRVHINNERSSTRERVMTCALTQNHQWQSQ